MDENLARVHLLNRRDIMNNRSHTILTLSSVGFITALIVDLYLLIAYTNNIELIIPVSLIVIVNTYFMVDGILTKIDEITTITIDKQNELTKVEKGIYSVAKREEIARNQSMSAILSTIIDFKDENTQQIDKLIEQEKLLSKLNIKNEKDNSSKLVNSNERLAVLIAQMATANAKSQEETIEILNDICKELEESNGKLDTKNDYAHLRVMKQ